MRRQQEKVVVMDFGGQAGQLLARRIRDAGVYSEVVAGGALLVSFDSAEVKGIICCGEPKDRLKVSAAKSCEEILRGDVPVMGVGYSMSLMVRLLKGHVPEDVSEDVSADVANELVVLTDDAHGIYGVADASSEVLDRFLFRICGCCGDWKMETFAESLIADIRAQVGGARVLGAISGGVDSSVAAVLVHKAVGDRLTSIFVDHGLLRHKEADEVMQTLQNRLGLKVIKIDAQKRFLDRLAGMEDPERKRKIIGEEFIYVFRDEAERLMGHGAAMDLKEEQRRSGSRAPLDAFLLQGTIYPDVIESGTAGGDVIKSHHNVGGIPEDMPFKGLVEPLRMLFKDEVRRLGEYLGIPRDMVWRQPFPGPGLAVRVIGAITEEKLVKVRLSDAILREEIALAGLEEEIWQYFTLLPGVRSVGIRGDKRSYDEVVAIRAVTSSDAMTAEWAEVPYAVLRRISSRIVAEVPGVNRVVYDVTAKPPGTIEWE